MIPSRNCNCGRTYEVVRTTWEHYAGDGAPAELITRPLCKYCAETVRRFSRVFVRPADPKPEEARDGKP